MVRTPALLLAALLLGAALVSCSDPVTEPQAGETGAQPDAVPDPDPSRPELSVPDPDPSRPEPSDPDRPTIPLQPASCSEAVADAVLTTIEAQLDAFARGDFAAALAEASPGFQAATDPDAFRRLIERDFGLLLDDASAEVEGCAERRPGLADVVVEVVTGDGARARYVYRLTFAEDRWGVDAAGRLDPPPATA